jgi:hypothetical protein
MKIFLTGATGFLGEYLLTRLLDRGHHVWCLYRNEARRLDTIDFLGSFGLPRSTKSLCWVKGDILEVAAHRLRQWTATRTGPWGPLLPLVLCAVLLAPAVMAAAGPGDAVLSLMAQMESSYARINDYRAIFHKQERVEGTLLPEETILLKFQKPLKIYMKWIAEPLKGTEALFVQGEYDNKLLAHRGGILGVVTLSLDPNGPVAMQGNRHPIFEAGFGFTLKEMRRNIDMALEHGEYEVIRMGEEVIKGRPAKVIEARFHAGGGRKYYASRTVVHIDRELMLPVGNAFYDDNDVLFEKYSFDDVKLNVGFTTLDFSRHNKEYRF